MAGAHLVQMNEKVNKLGLMRYDAMIAAIEECYSVDEVKEIRDRARALEVYAAQALNLGAERHAAQIRIRAERRTGEILKEMKESGERKTAAAGRPKASEAPTLLQPSLADLGISRDQSSQWQRLAEIPKEKFEEALQIPGVDIAEKKRFYVPTTEGVLQAAGAVKRPPIPPIDRAALMVYGRIHGFEEVLNQPGSNFYAKLHDFQQEELKGLIPKVIVWLQEMIA